MDISVLEKAGLKTNEAKIYIALLENGLSLVSDIYKKISIHRRNIYDALERLQDKGLVTVSIKNGKKHFEAVNPDKLLDYLQEKEEGIRQILPNLKSRYDAVKSSEEGQMFKGIEGMKTIMQDMLNVGETIYVVGGKGKWVVDEMRFYFPRFDKERVKKKIRTKQIFDYEMKKRKELPSIKYGEYRFFPKKYSSPTHIWIYRDRVVTAFWGDTQFAFMIKSDKVSEGYKKFFNFIWNNLAQ